MNRDVSCAVLLACLLGACASTAPPAPSPPVARMTREAMVAAIRASADRDKAELSVQPLRDPKVEDLRMRAHELESQHRYRESAAALDQALSLVADDPALLQERAEAALLLDDPATAERLARQADAIDAQVGPLCRRHWATIAQTRSLAGDAAGQAVAQARIAACKVTGPDRY
jgi:hypothetical protein